MLLEVSSMTMKAATCLDYAEVHQSTMVFLSPAYRSECAHIANGANFWWVGSWADIPLRRLERWTEARKRRIDGMHWSGRRTNGMCYKTSDITTTHVRWLGRRIEARMRRVDGMHWSGGWMNGICYKTSNIATTHVIVRSDVVRKCWVLIIIFHQGGVCSLVRIWREFAGNAQLRGTWEKTQVEVTVPSRLPDILFHD